MWVSAGRRILGGGSDASVYPCFHRVFPARHVLVVDPCSATITVGLISYYDIVGSCEYCPSAMIRPALQRTRPVSASLSARMFCLFLDPYRDFTQAVTRFVTVRANFGCTSATVRLHGDRRSLWRAILLLD